MNRTAIVKYVKLWTWTACYSECDTQPEKLVTL